jgi:hypothetical protein
MFQSLTKKQFPWLNRQQRRHPKALSRKMTAATQGNAVPWLLYGLLVRGGFVKPKVVAPAAIRPAGKSIFSRLQRAFGAGLQKLFS